MPMPFLFSRKKDKSNARLWDNEDLNLTESDEDQVFIENFSSTSSTPSINSPRSTPAPAPEPEPDTSTQPIKKSEIFRMDYYSNKAKIAVAPDFRPKLPTMEELNKDLVGIEKVRIRAKKIKEQEEMENSKKISKLRPKTDALKKSSKSKSKKLKGNSSWDNDINCDSSELDKFKGRGDQKFQDQSDKKSSITSPLIWKNKNGYNDDFFLY